MPGSRRRGVLLGIGTHPAGRALYAVTVDIVSAWLLCQGLTTGERESSENQKCSIGHSAGHFHISVFLSMSIGQIGDWGFRDNRRHRFQSEP